MVNQPVTPDFSETQQFTFSYQFTDEDELKPRGGATKGADITLDQKVSAAWMALQEPSLSDFERDRRAILAMAGPYRTSFDFLETVRFNENAPVQRPYQSWGTEYVYVVEDSGDFISLQHIMVMFFKNDEGEISGPMVMKHWRQDWKYEDTERYVYKGHNRWAHESLPTEKVVGTWSQSVFQVDDSPRYESYGRWEHQKGFSTWLSANTWRPLPRREFSVRDDYHVLAGTNRHTIISNGWIHEQENLKLALDESGKPQASSPFLAKEIGLNRYERIIGHDFSAGDAYWQKTGSFWQQVREYWASLMSENEEIALHKKVDGQGLFMPLFTFAEKVSSSGDYDEKAAKTFIRETISKYVKNEAGGDPASVLKSY